MPLLGCHGMRHGYLVSLRLQYEYELLVAVPQSLRLEPAYHELQTNDLYFVFVEWRQSRPDLFSIVHTRGREGTDRCIHWSPSCLGHLGDCLRRDRPISSKAHLPFSVDYCKLSHALRHVTKSYCQISCREKNCVGLWVVQAMWYCYKLKKS